MFAWASDEASAVLPALNIAPRPVVQAVAHRSVGPPVRGPAMNTRDVLPHSGSGR